MAVLVYWLILIGCSPVAIVEDLTITLKCLTVDTTDIATVVLVKGN